MSTEIAGNNLRLEFPSDKVEARASGPEQALVRELEEELGIVVNEACLAPLDLSADAVRAALASQPALVAYLRSATSTHDCIFPSTFSLL